MTSPVIAIVLPVANAVAVAAFPVVLPEVPEVLPVTFPVTFPVNAPTNIVEVNVPVLGLYVNPVSDSKPCVPVAPSTKTGYTVSFAELFAAIVISGAVPADAHDKTPLPSVCNV